jgi:hypothetical protein
MTTTNGRWTLTRIDDRQVRIENNVTMFSDTALKISPCDTCGSWWTRSYLVYNQPEVIPRYVRLIAKQMVNAHDC